MSNSIARMLFLVSFCLLAGCRIGASVFEGGDILSASGTRHCFEGGTCEFRIEDPDFSESFTARPRTGFEFSKWKSGEGFLCGDSVDPTCTVALPGGEAAEAIIALDKMFYIMPEFVCVGYCPERPDPNWRALDEAIVALEQARKLVDAYVETNGGHYPYASTAFGLNTSLRSYSAMLDYIDVTDGLSSGDAVYITAHVDTCVWDGSICTGIADSTAAFSLSGATNADGSLSWHCIPGDPKNPSVPNGPNAIPEPYLPFNCRG